MFLLAHGTARRSYVKSVRLHVRYYLKYSTYPNASKGALARRDVVAKRSREDRVSQALTILETRWAARILYALSGAALRYGEIRARIPGITDRVLSGRLRELEQLGLVRRRVIASRPPAASYSLTKAALGLQPTFASLGSWQMPAHIRTRSRRNRRDGLIC